ncbi:MAG: protein translocase subunit SecF [Vampirovibrionales bacterium]
MTTTITASTPSAQAPAAASLMDYLPKGPVNLLKQQSWFVALSALLLIPSMVFMVLLALQQPNHAPLKLGIDFTGGTLVEMAFEKPLTAKDTTAIQTVVAQAGFDGAVVQLQSAHDALTPPNAPAAVGQPAKKSHQPSNQVATLRTAPLPSGAMTTISQGITQQVGPFTLLQKTAIGPTLATELLTNGLLALVAAYVLIVGFLTFRFQLDYAVCAILALIHDTVFVLGVFAALGYLYGVEVDGLFITAILTVVGFSVHDTIIVFDRIRENLRLFYSKKLPFAQIVDISINQTLGRSINTSVTALLPMVTLYLFGGESTRWFTFALIIGITAGTYSSIWVASLLLVWWRTRNAPAS